MSATDFALRDITTCDFKRLKKAHASLLPIAYENDFFIKVCGKEHAHFGLCAEGDDPTNLAGFATARQVGIEALCPNDRRALNSSGIPVDDISEIFYVLTIGVGSRYRRRGLAHSLMQGIVREALHRDCAAVLLHTPTNNSAACGLYRKLGFLHLRKHLSFYSLPAPNTASQASKRLLPVQLDAYLFGRSTHIPFRSPCRSTNSEEDETLHTPPTAELAGTSPTRPFPRTMYQTGHDPDTPGGMMHAQHEYTQEPALPTSQAALLADVGFSGALVRSTEAAGVVFGMMSDWFRGSCTAQVVPHGACSFQNQSVSAQHSGQQQDLQSSSSGIRGVEPPRYGSGVELPVLGSRTATDRDDSDSGLRKLLSDGARDSMYGFAAMDESSSGTTASDCSTERWSLGHYKADLMQNSQNGGSSGTRGISPSRLQPHAASAAPDLTIFQRLFGRP